MGDVYQKIATQVLRHHRVPLSARQIMEFALLSRIVPPHLYGKTQHKTLQARLSTDIRKRGKESAFLRTDPGRFFLRELLLNSEVPEKFKTEFFAPKRSLQLQYEPSLVAHVKVLEDVPRLGRGFIDPEAAMRAISLSPECDQYQLIDKEIPRGVRQVLSYVVVRRDRFVLTYKKGKLADDGGNTIRSRSIGFSTPVWQSDLNLFDRHSLGIQNACFRELQDDLGMSPFDSDEAMRKRAVDLRAFLLWPKSKQLAAISVYSAPKHFEPTKQRLAIGELQWTDIDLSRKSWRFFDPLSAHILRADAVEVRGRNWGLLSYLS